MAYANQIIDAIQTIAQNEVAGLKFDKTIRASIIEATDPSIGKYRVRYQNSSFYAYALDLKTYNKGTNVFVVIPSSDFNKDPYIMGTVKKLGADFVDVVTLEDKMSLVGDNIVMIVDEEKDNTIRLSSFRPEEKIVYRDESQWNFAINQQSLDMYKQDSEYMMIGAKFTTSIPDNQKIGSGDYGIRVVCKYWDSRYKSKEDVPSDAAPIYKSYILNVKNMTGQPYNYTSGNEQNAIFPIDSEHLVAIESISAFCQDFPNENHEAKADILISDLKIEFYDALSESEIQGISLRITTPHGGYFYKRNNQILPVDDKSEPAIKMEAVLRIKGRRVNPDQKVNYYWFIRDDKIQTDSNDGYHRYGGPGWRCINNEFKSYPSGTTYKKEYLTDQYSHYLPYYDSENHHEVCPAYKTFVKCVAIFEQDSGSTIIDVEKVIYNSLKVDSNNIYIESLMGTIFNFNTGLTDLTCRFKNDANINYDRYDFVWTRSIDGQDREAVDNTSRKLLKVDISLASSFVTYSCSVYERSSQLFIGAAEITLSNQAVQGEYRLVLHNGTQVFKYDGKGISPMSSSVSEESRLDLGTYALSFDIYDDKGQRIDLGDDQNKHRIVDIKWIWPSTSNIAPDLQRTGFESMLLPETLVASEKDSVFEQETIPSPYDSKNEIKRWVRKDQANLQYQIQPRYDPSKINNTIQLEVTYKGYILTASTNFTFTKEGELGTNGTKYYARLVPKNVDNVKCEKIIIIYTNNGNYGFYAVKADGTTKKITDFNLNNIFTMEIWDGGVTAVATPIPTWSTAREERGLNYNRISKKKINTSFLVVDGNNLRLDVNQSRLQNHTLKAKATVSSLSAQPFYCEYPMEVYYNLNYNIAGGYKNGYYESDGTRADFSTKGFILNFKGSPVTFNSGDYWESSWVGDKYTTKINTKGVPATSVKNNKQIKGVNDVVIEPPAYYQGQDINNYIACYYTPTGSSQILAAIIPINLVLNKFGLSAIDGWDGTSIKLNAEGDNYILAPQMGAGIRESNDTFTGIVAGKTMETTDTNNMGLFGYHAGERSIFLDAKTGDATFGKSGKNQIKLKAEQGYVDITTASGDGISLRGSDATIQSHDYNTTNKTGMKIKFSGNPYITFGSGNFSVNAQGELTAKGGGSIAGWSIGNNTLTSIDNKVQLISNATGGQVVFSTPQFKVYADGSFIASNNKFKVTKDGVLTATGGTIAGWNFDDKEIYKGTGADTNMFIHKDGAIGGGTGGTYSGHGHSGLKWKIENDGIGYFSDVRINNTTTSSAQQNIISIGNRTGSQTGGSFTVDNSGNMTAAKANIEGTISSQEGDIGGWIIKPDYIQGGNFTLYSSGRFELGDNYTFDSSGGNGTNTNRNGSSIGAGNVYGGSGAGSGSGGEGTSWQDVVIHECKKNGSTQDIHYVTSVNFETKNAPTSTAHVALYDSWERTLRLLVWDKG